MQYSTIYGAITTRVNDASTNVTNVAKADVNFAYQDVCTRHPFTWLTALGTLTTTASQAYTQISTGGITDLWKILSVRENVTPQLLSAISMKDYDRLLALDNTDTDIPDLYSDEINDYIYWYKTPDDVYTIYVEYWKAITELSSDSDSPIIPAKYHEVLVLGGWARTLRYLKQFAEAEAISAQYEAFISKMIEEDDDRTDKIETQAKHLMGQPRIEGGIMPSRYRRY